MEDLKTFLAWSKRQKYMNLWERVGKVYALAPLKVETHQRPWGVIPKIDTSGGARVLCGAMLRDGSRTCLNVAGESTSHMGAGWCGWHLGNSRPGNLEGFMLMAMAFADRFEITPAEALQEEVERTVGGVRWLDDQVRRAELPEDLLPGGEYGEFVDWRAKERSHLVKVAVAAINAGVSQILAEQSRIEATQIVQILNRAIGVLGLTPEKEDEVRAVLAKDLLAIGAKSVDSGVDIE